MAMVKKCSSPYCSVKLKDGSKTCPKHIGEKDRLYNKYHRDDKYSKFYQSVEYKRFRKEYVKYKKFCEICLKKQMYVNDRLVFHHKIEIREDFSKRLDIDNMILICQSCHNRIHKLKQHN